MRTLKPFLLALLAASPAFAAEPLVVHSREITDSKAVVATVEPIRQLLARARIGGVIAALNVKEGDVVPAGAVVAQVTDAKIALQIQALDSRIASAQSQRDQAKNDFARAQELQAKGVSSQTQFDQAKTNLDVAERNLAAIKGDREVLAQQAIEGQVLAPAAGRVLTIPVSVGRVVMPGEPIATLAEDQYILRLELPERHARFLRAGDKVRLGARGLDDDDPKSMREGVVRIVYPEIQGGRVIADVEVSGLGDYFVGERTRAYIGAGQREVILVPVGLVFRRAGVNYVRLQGGDEVVVQPGDKHDDNGVETVEILAGLRDGDALVAP